VTIAVDAESRKLARKPRIITRGFVDAADEQALIEKGQDAVQAALDHDRGRLADVSFVDTRVRESLGRFLYERIHRRPIIIPVVMEVGKSERKQTS
jgi:ribonuclease J